MQRTPIIQAQNLYYEIANQDNYIRILQGLNLTIHTGEQVAIIGSSGSGKSTLLSLLAGLDVPTSGQVLVEMQAFSSLDEDGRALVRAHNMSFVFQSFQLLPSLTALENVMLPLQLTQHADAQALSLEALDQVGLSQRVQHYPKQLSGGEQQRVAIARAFATKPRILFADEPTGNLDTKSGQQICEIFQELNRKDGLTIVLTTHNQKLGTQAKRVVYLKDGTIVSREESSLCV